MRARTSWFPVAVLLLAACSSDTATDGTSATSSSATTTSVAVDTSVGTTTTAGGNTSTTATTTVTPTTAPATTEPCVAEGDTARKESDDPLAMSGLVGTDIRTGAHPCFERVVIELGGTGPGTFPGWWVEYVDDPVTLGESNETAFIEGDATLLVRMGMWMPNMDGEGWDGPTQLFPTNVSHILELRQTENWEGVSIWTIGLDGEYPFTVDVYEDPYRLVIDIQTG